MTLAELFDKLERIKELRDIPFARRTNEEVYELSQLEDIQLKELTYEE